MGKVNNALRMLAILRSRKKVTRKELACQMISLKNTIGLFKDEKYEIKLRISYPYAMSFKEYSWTQDEHIEDYMEEGYLIYTATVEGKTKIISWIMGMGTSCTVLEPKKLIEDVIKEHKKVLNNYKQFFRD